jgi:alpha-tubulin suppressor-like RCC1 family protein
MSRSTRTVSARGATITLWLAGAALSGVSCRGDNIADPTPGTPAEKGPALATTSTALTFRQVSAGSFHTCAVTTDDRAYCWGSGGSGQLGQGYSGDRLTPSAVLGGLQFRTVSAGAGSTCGLTTDGRAYCWGQNVYGQLGDGTTTTRLTPVRVLGGLRFRQLDKGEYHACGLTALDRKAYCWGDNRYGQLGDGTKTNRPRPVAVLGGRVFRQVSGGGQHTCAVTPTYKTYCWGDNRFGQLGDGTMVLLRPRPALVAGGRTFSQVDAGRLQTCAVTTGSRAFCWGSHFPDNTPRAVAGGISFDRVSAGTVHTCGETTGNRAYCWGDNSRGQLGDGTTTQRLTPVAVAGGLTFAQVSAAVGGLHTCGRTSGGVAYCWGNNSAGGLGDGTTTTRLSPVAVAGPM